MTHAGKSHLGIWILKTECESMQGQQSLRPLVGRREGAQGKIVGMASPCIVQALLVK